MLVLETRVPVHFPIIEFENAVFFFQSHDRVVFSRKQLHVEGSEYCVDFTNFVYYRFAGGDLIEQHLADYIFVREELVAKV